MPVRQRAWGGPRAIRCSALLLNLLVVSCVSGLSQTADAAPPAAAARGVLTGIDVLEGDQFKLLRGQRLGLITNHTGRNRAGVSTLELLHRAPEIELVAIFSPEHGFEGKLDVAKIGDARDAATGLPIFSLYGETRRPTPEMLSTIDTLVFDIQDIGTRFYTYVSTMGEAMHASEEQGKRFVVLDRPNPINGKDVAGPMLDRGKESFVGFHTLPVRHGMTIGELAKLLGHERFPKLQLEVVACRGWRRDTYWESTGLQWVNPSPNMRCLTQAVLYPGIGLLETTNLSVGRGTDTPFELIGAPWLDGRRLAEELNHAAVPGTAFVPIEFTPTSSVYSGEPCGGVNIIVTDRALFEPVRTSFEIASRLRALYPEVWNAKGYLRLMGNDAVQEALLAGQPAAELERTAEQGVAEFLERRRLFLLYE